MAEITFPLSVSVEGCADAPLRSLFSVFEVLAASSCAREAVAERFPDLFHAELGGGIPNLVLDRCDLFFGETVLHSASGTLKVTLNPSDRYLELVTTLTGRGYAARDFDIHLWPILSVVPSTTTVREAGGESIPAGGATQ